MSGTEAMLLIGLIWRNLVREQVMLGALHLPRIDCEVQLGGNRILYNIKEEGKLKNPGFMLLSHFNKMTSNSFVNMLSNYRGGAVAFN